MSPSLKGKVCIVTGSTKGIGRGIALRLGQAGATVYVTGRTKAKIDECVEEINRRGGKGIGVQVDHGNDQEVEAFFERVKSDQRGQLDVLVNNAYAGVDTIAKSRGKEFYTMEPVEHWDKINGVGLRGHFLCTVYASRIMTQNRTGLIVNVSSPGGLRYLFNVAYGIGKSAVDRMAADCAVELKKSNVTMVSLWPGPVKTEYIAKNRLGNEPDGQNNFYNAESMEFAGQAVSNLAADPNVISKTGKIVMTCDLAWEYDFVDEDGDRKDYRSLKNALISRNRTWMAAVVPSFVRIPLTVMHFGSYKF